MVGRFRWERRTAGIVNPANNSQGELQQTVDVNGTPVNAFYAGAGAAGVPQGYFAAPRFFATNGIILRSNTFPITSFAELGNSGCVFWNSNGVGYLVCTNSLTTTATTNLIVESGGGTGIATNSGSGTNNVFTGFTTDGSTTNAPGAVHTGGRVETNYATKSFSIYTNASLFASNGTAIRAGTFYVTNGPTQSLLYLGTNPPSSGLATAIAQGAIGSTNVLQIDVPNVNAAFAVHTNGGAWFGVGLSNNGPTRLSGNLVVAGASTLGSTLWAGAVTSGNAYSVLAKTSPYTISQFVDSARVIVNTGAAGPVTNTLSAATGGGLNYKLCLTAAQMMGFKAAAGDVFVDATLGTSATGATLMSSTQFAVIEITTVESGKWIILNSRGTWTY
jgi:hypothetical protein